jgi:hypothetical protein
MISLSDFFTVPPVRVAAWALEHHKGRPPGGSRGLDWTQARRSAVRQRGSPCPPTGRLACPLSASDTHDLAKSGRSSCPRCGWPRRVRRADGRDVRPCRRPPAQVWLADLPARGIRRCQPRHGVAVRVSGVLVRRGGRFDGPSADGGSTPVPRVAWSAFMTLPPGHGDPRDEELRGDWAPSPNAHPGRPAASRCRRPPGDEAVMRSWRRRTPTSTAARPDRRRTRFGFVGRMPW